MRRCAAILLTLGLGLAGPTALADPATKVVHGLSLLDNLKYPADFKQLDYVNPDAPKGGLVRRFSIGSFDSFNPFIIKGDSAPGIGFVFETLMTSPMDDISSEYGLIAESVEVPEDLSWVAYRLRPEAKFHDGSPITVEDVIFSFNILKTKGAPHYRFYYANVESVEKTGERTVTFRFSGPPNRELPQIVGQLAVLPKAYWETRDFSKTTLERPLGSGPYRIGDFEPGRSITYERVADYWGKDLPINRGRFNFDQIRYDMYRDGTVAMEAFKAGGYDFRVENSAKRWATGYQFKAVNENLVKVEEIPHGRPTGMQAFVMNTRKSPFSNRLFRQALAYAYDFQWSRKTLFYGQYHQPASYFSNSDLASSGLPSAAELEILEPYRGRIPEEVFTKEYQPPKTDGSGNIRKNLRQAAKLMKAAGFQVKDKKLVDPATGQPVEIEFLYAQPSSERLLAPIAKNLERLGIAARLRMVDSAQYANRAREFDFDIITISFGQSESPGNEQRDYWGSEAADRPGSRNYIGIKDPVVDELIEKLVAAPDRKTLITVTRALDRVLLWGHYVIPQLISKTERIAYWNKFGRAPIQPKYGVDFTAWWVDPELDQAMASGRAALKKE